VTSPLWQDFKSTLPRIWAGGKEKQAICFAGIRLWFAGAPDPENRREKKIGDM
jgi:hypothetical protein